MGDEIRADGLVRAKVIGVVSPKMQRRAMEQYERLIYIPSPP